MIEIYQLKQLLTFAEYGTLSKAAEVLHISQPSLSRTMQQIESELQITLFDRQKNRLTLNENGKLTVEYAKKVIDQLNDLVFHVRSFDRMNNTISIGSCAPIPNAQIVKMLRDTYPDMTISSEIKNIKQLIEGLHNDTYHFIILPAKPSDTDGLFIKAFLEEHLMFSLPKTHPKACEQNLYLSDINGQNMIIMPNLGFWEDIIKQKMPNSRFLVQTDKISFEELIQASILPSFTTNLALLEYLHPNNRVAIPILDPEVNVTFYYQRKP